MRLLRDKLGLADEPMFDAQYDRAQWPAQNGRLAAIFETKTRDEWCALMEGTRRVLRAGAVDGRGAGAPA